MEVTAPGSSQRVKGLSTAVSTLALVLLGACAGGAADPVGNRNAPEQTPPVVGAADHTLPAPSSGDTTLTTTQPYSVFLNVMLQGRSLASIHDEEQNFIAECMGERGFAYKPVPFGVVDQAPDFTGSIASLRSYREAYGYGVNTQPSSVLSDPNAPLLEALSEPEQQAFYAQLVGGTEANGPDTDSCTSRAQASARSGVPYFDPAYEAVFDSYLGRLESDPRFVAGVEQWSSCMKAGGYEVAHPDDMTTYALARFQNAPELELQAARTDQDCYEETLAAVRPIVDAEILMALVDEGALPAGLLGS
jgi:hypothetical protein